MTSEVDRAEWGRELGPLPEGHQRPAGSRTTTLAAKLALPMAAGHEIERTALCQKVLGAASARLTLLRAPAGFGKTTLMLEIRNRLEHLGVPTAWLTVDPADNDVGRFLSALNAALSPIIAQLASTTPGSKGPDELALGVLGAVEIHKAPFALFLDDFEAVQGAAVFGLVRELIGRLPAGARIVIGSRVVPDLGLGRMRANGSLVEIQPSQLRFTIEETESYICGRRGLSLSNQDLVRLHRSTEGWAAALSIASVSLENRKEPGRFIAGFTGSNAAIVDYLLEDVLIRLDDKARRFLLRTSIAGDLVPSLCDQLCNTSDSLEMLYRLEREHLFLVPIQGDGPRWRYHSMFAEFLRAQLARHYSREVPALHALAARWYLARGRPVPAIEHTIAAGETTLAAKLLTQHAERLLQQGRLRLLARWLDRLIETGHIEHSPTLQAVHAWSVLLSRGPRAAEPLLERLERLEQPSHAVDAHRRALRLLFLVLLDRTDEAMGLAEALMRDLPPRVSFVRGFVEVVLANLAMIASHYKEALRLADAARSRKPDSASAFVLALSESVEGAVDLTQGRLRKAIAHLRLAVQAGADSASGATNGNAMAGVLLAEALYETDQPEEAERLLTVYIPLIRAVGIPDQLIIAHTIMARIAWRRGDEDKAQQLLAELELAGHQQGLDRVIASARLERARALIVQGRLDEGRAEIDRCGDRTLWERINCLSLRANEVETHELGLARWAIRGPQPEAVVSRLRPEVEAAERAHRARRALTLRLVLAQAYYRSGHRNKGMRTLAKAVGLASTEGYLTALQDEGPLLLAMLRELRECPDLFAEAAPPPPSLLAFIGKAVGEAAEERLPGDAPPPVPEDLAASGRQDLLTRKERRVLALAAEGLSNDELADRLFVAETTVRTHLRNINAKLSTHSRTQAIAIARRNGWIQ